MKWVAIALNVLLVLCMGYLMENKGYPRDNGDIFMVILVFAAPLFSLVALWGAESESWVALYFRRKALEERHRIQKLEKQ